MRALRPPRPPRRVVACGAVGLAALAIAVIVVAATGGGGTNSAAATRSTATTEVVRQDLVEVSSEDGTLGYGDGRKVVNRLSGTVTWLPATGTVVEPDETLYRVDGSPVILLNGRVPAYRALSPNVSDGADVEQLERGLRALGYDTGGTMELDRSWDSGTTAAVKRWQEAHGFAETGAVKLGRIVFQPGARRVSEVDATLGANGSSGGQGGSSDSDPPTDGASTGAGRTQFAAFTQTTPDAPPEDEAAKRKAAEEKAKREEAKRRAAERALEKLKAQQKAASQPQQQDQTSQQPRSGTSSSDEPTASTPIMTTTSTRAVVTVDLDTTKQSLARRRDGVTVELPSGDTADGRIESVGKVATSPPEEEGADPDAGGDTATIEVTVRLAKRTKALDQAPVTVNFEQSKRRGVLSVPVTALLARAGGKFAVEVRDAGRRRLVAVKPGLYADGYVEITGSGLRPGTKVTDARV